MYEFDSRQLINGDNRKKFIETICRKVSYVHLDRAVTEAQSNHWYGANQSYLRMAADATVVPFFLRWNRGNGYSAHYEAMKFAVDEHGKSKTPSELLLGILEGPKNGLAKGGFGVNSFKWFILESLGEQICPPLEKEMKFKDAPGYPPIPDETSSAILSEMMEHLSQLPEWEGDNKQCLSGKGPG